MALNAICFLVHTSAHMIYFQGQVYCDSEAARVSDNNAVQIQEGSTISE